MKQILQVLSAVLLSLILMSSACRKTKTESLTDYGTWPRSTRTIIEENFSVLPSVDIVNSFGYSYYYNEPSSVLGDKNFVIIISLKYPDKEHFANELKKYNENYVHANTNNIFFYPQRYSMVDVLGYLDSEFYDGMFYNFEFILANVNDYTVHFVVAHVWDYYKDQSLIEYLQQIQDDFTKS